MKNDIFENYLRDLGFEIKELALKAKKKRDASRGTDEEPFNNGYLMGFHRVVTLMQQQAEAFGIPLNKINLDDIEADDVLI